MEDLYVAKVDGWWSVVQEGLTKSWRVEGSQPGVRHGHPADRDRYTDRTGVVLG